MEHNKKPEQKNMPNKNSTTKTSVVFFLLLLVGGPAITSAAAGGERILLKDVGALVLKPGEMTSARRTAALPQLSCNGGVGCHGKYALDSVMCKNEGTDGRDINWECNAEMPVDVKFGLIEVSCEGYDYPEDPYVLVGSCQLRYNLKRRAGVENSVPTYTRHPPSSNSGIGLGGLLMGCILLWALGNSCGGNSHRGGYRGANGPGFWSGVATGAVAGTALGGGYRRRHRGWGWGGGRRTSIWGSNRRRSGGGTYCATGHARTVRC